MSLEERKLILEKIISSINSCEADNSDICNQLYKVQNSLDNQEVFDKELTVLNDMLKGDYDGWSN